MGQQQLLLLVIGVVLVGVAVMAGFYAFEVKFDQHLVDHLVERNLTIASEAIAWKLRTDPYRGGHADYNALAAGGFEALFLGEETLNGCYKFSSASGQDLVIDARSTHHPNIGARTFVTGADIDSTLTYYDGTITITCAVEAE